MYKHIFFIFQYWLCCFLWNKLLRTIFLFSCFKIRYLFRVCSVSANRLHVALQIQPALMTSQVGKTPSHVRTSAWHKNCSNQTLPCFYSQEKLIYLPLTLYHWVTTSILEKLKQMAIYWFSVKLPRPTSGAKMATYERGTEFGIFAVKSQFSS